MIIEALINLVTVVIKLLAIPFNILPDTPEALTTAVDSYLDLVFSNLSFISFFVNVDTLKTVALIAIAIYTLEKAYTLLIWIIHKLPVSVD